MSGKIQFIADFRAGATQLGGYRHAGDWMRLAEQVAAEGVTLTADEAARWASAGYLPDEAAPLIRDGMTAAVAEDLDRLSTDLAGGHELRAAQRVDELVADGTLVDPARVRQVQDPDDPDHIIVHVDCRQA